MHILPSGIVAGAPQCERECQLLVDIYLRVLVEPTPAESPDELSEDRGRGVEVDLNVTHGLHHLDRRVVGSLSRAVHDDDLYPGEKQQEARFDCKKGYCCRYRLLSWWSKERMLLRREFPRIGSMVQATWEKPPCSFLPVHRNETKQVPINTAGGDSKRPVAVKAPALLPAEPVKHTHTRAHTHTHTRARTHALLSFLLQWFTSMRRITQADPWS